MTGGSPLTSGPGDPASTPPNEPVPPKPSVHSRSGLGRALLFTSVGAMIIPVVGLISAPVLARALGVSGRGELAAALAPAVLLISVGTLGLPQAVTYFVARDPSSRRAVLNHACGFSLGVGVAAAALIALATPILSGGRSSLVAPMLLAVAFAVPALLVNVMRALAAGLQVWALTTIERGVSGGGRLVALLVLLWSGHLTLLTALLVMTLTPLLGGVVYLGLLWRGGRYSQHDQDAVASGLLSFGLRTWGGSIAGILLARLDQTLFASVSTTQELGIYAVAVTVSDLLYLLVGAVTEGLFGVTSKRADPDLVAAVARISTIVIFVLAAVFAGSMPFWLEALFGSGFGRAFLPSILLLMSSIIQIPGTVASTGMAAQGRPGARTIALIVAMLVNLVAFYLAVPPLGAVGAALAMIAANLAMSLTVLLQVNRLLGVHALAFLGVRRSDLTLLKRRRRR